jgi:hypothetical protein
MRPYTASIALAVLFTAAAAQAAERPIACRTNPAVVGACFTVHGSMSAHNGAPTFRIHVDETKRMLGVRGDQDGLPPELIPILMGPNGDAFGKLFPGDYTVCPFTEERAGHMRMVCVEDAKNVKVRWIEHR